MQSIDFTKPGEKKKLIWAGLLGFAALIVMWWALFGFGSSSTPAQRAAATPTPAATPRTQTAGPNRPVQAVSAEVADLKFMAPISYEPSSYNPPDVKRNIFAYYVPPVKPVAPVQEPTPPPPPPAPLLLASVSPSNVYARSADFKLDVAGDKFTPAVKIYFDGRELPTTYSSPQQLSATVPAAMIAAPGSRNIVVRTPDNSLFSATVSLNVAAPPTPNYSYIGIIGEYGRVKDTAIVQDKGNKNTTLNVHRGDVLSGRFRVVSISDKELVMMDTTLKIKHTLAMSEGDKGFGPMARPTPRVESEDDEP